MNCQMAYLLGMILGNGEIYRRNRETTVSIEIPHKNLVDDSGRNTSVYVAASLVDIRTIIEPLVGRLLTVSQSSRATTISFTKDNSDYTMREIIRLTGEGVRHNNMRMLPELFDLSTDEKKELVRGFADVTGYIRKSNIAFGQPGHHRVYIEIPSNWGMVIDLANLLKSLDIPVQTIDFGHPNFRDSALKKYNEGKTGYWKKEHQLKIWAVEFLPVGFNIKHKQESLLKYASEQEEYMDRSKTHKYYWEGSNKASKVKPRHPGENDESLPIEIRGKHFDKWTDLANALGYGKDS